MCQPNGLLSIAAELLTRPSGQKVRTAPEILTPSCVTVLHIDYVRSSGLLQPNHTPASTVSHVYTVHRQHSFKHVHTFDRIQHQIVDLKQAHMQCAISHVLFPILSHTHAHTTSGRYTLSRYTHLLSGSEEAVSCSRIPSSLR